MLTRQGQGLVRHIGYYNTCKKALILRIVQVSITKGLNSEMRDSKKLQQVSDPRVGQEGDNRNGAGPGLRLVT